jgi:serine/threonine protein kinase
VALAYQHIERPPTPPSQIAGAVSGEVEAIVLRALAKDPADRYQRAEEMRAEIAQVLAGNPAGSQADVRPSKAVRRLKGSSKLRSERVGSARADDPPTRELDQFNPSPRLIAEPQRPSRATATRPRHVWPITLLAVTALVASGFLGWLVIKDHLTTTEIDPTAPVTTDPTDGPVAEIVLTVGRYSTDLSELNLSQFHLTPTDVEQLRHMTNLTHLHLSETGIVNLSPLSGLTNLTYLYLNGNALSNIDALKGLTNLTHLYLALNAISDISALSELANLKVLNLNVNRVSDLSPLSGLTHLTDLYLSENKISDLSPLESLSNLQAILLKRNPLTDSDITNLQSHLPNCEIHWP